MTLDAGRRTPGLWTYPDSTDTAGLRSDGGGIEAALHVVWGRFFMGEGSLALLRAPSMGTPSPLALSPVALLLLASCLMYSWWMVPLTCKPVAQAASAPVPAWGGHGNEAMAEIVRLLVLPVSP